LQKKEIKMTATKSYSLDLETITAIQKIADDDEIDPKYVAECDEIARQVEAGELKLYSSKEVFNV
jgi:uncharacterized membrane protein YjjP (DUF1212 family)